MYIYTIYTSALSVRFVQPKGDHAVEETGGLAGSLAAFFYLLYVQTHKK